MSKGKRNKRRGFQLKRERKRVAILTPCQDQVSTEFAISLLNLCQTTNAEAPPGLHSMNFKALGTSLLPKGRQNLVDAALKEGATHVLWIDSDMKFPPNMLLRFLTRDEEIVGINAMSRRQPYHNCAQYADGKQVQTTPDTTGIEKVDRMGFGVLWVDTKVYAEMSRPFMDFEYIPEIDTWMGEDYYFMKKAHALGFECYCDHDLSKEVLHIGQFGYNPLLSETMGAPK